MPIFWSEKNVTSAKCLERHSEVKRAIGVLVVVVICRCGVSGVIASDTTDNADAPAAVNSFSQNSIRRNLTVRRQYV
jgi:hypothetical protein